jgi:hypothetical protein
MSNRGRREAAIYMTEIETKFYMREIQLQWRPTTLSLTKVAELVAANLIEVNEGTPVEVRLTSKGAQHKFAGRPDGPTDAKAQQKTPGGFKNRRQRYPRKNLKIAQRLG